jgi:hypothetical protein
MDEEVKAWARAQIIEQTKGMVYCDLMLQPEEAVALEQLVIALRADGQHQALDRIFGFILEEIEASRSWHPDEPWPGLGEPD